MNKFFVALPLIATLIGCAGYVPGRQSYWDAQVKELCAKDGGVQIFEKLRVSEQDLVYLDKLDGKVSVPSKDSANPNSVAYSEFKLSPIYSAGSLAIDRAESTIVRRSDQVVIARWVVYKRSGGDIPTGIAHDSSFTCPDLTKIASDLQQLFIVERNSK